MPNFVQPRGDANSPVAFIGYKPSEEDEAKGTVFIDTVGWFLDKMIQESHNDIPFFTTVQPLFSQNFPDNICFQGLLQNLDQKKYPFIITCDSRTIKGEKLISDTLLLLCPETKGDLGKYTGSLLVSPYISWPHYVMPILSPQYIFQNYYEKDIIVSLDLARLKEEVDYYRINGIIQPLPARTLITNPNYSELCDFLFSSVPQQLNKQFPFDLVASDIETIRPGKANENKKSKFVGHPGYPYTISLATSPSLGISFSFWDYTDEQAIKIWRQLDWILRNISQIGQNYFLFDIYFLEALGFRPCIERCYDTLIRHHILWPELPHSLQFQTRQYTRQPYYKDEGKNWSPKNKQQLMRYNALDTTVDYEIFIAQEEEFNDRPYLK